ncbi:RimJ/RimL family protein N-acetyltransferase [Streptacidiphilus sp. MAP12-33]|uniref:GNAT family N-acetyltransferase n=1 Tax=Streptacidiphilus sp. MAP12-33 TaxID=3156266 RepID=UPI0035199DA5
MNEQHHRPGESGPTPGPAAASATASTTSAGPAGVPVGSAGVPAQHRLTTHARPHPAPWPGPPRPRRDDLLDGVARWGAMYTRHGVLRLQPVRLPRDLALLVEWMNDPVVSTFWELCGPADLTEHHVRVQLDGDGRSVPCLGLLDGAPMSYWEVYRADLDPLARHYPARPHDTGIHLLIGPSSARGRGLGGTLIAALTQRILRERQACHRVVAEPDVRNLPSVRAFLRAGFRYDSELLLPEKHAALMVYDRVL